MNSTVVESWNCGFRNNGFLCCSGSKIMINFIFIKKDFLLNNSGCFLADEKKSEITRVYAVCSRSKLL